MGTEVYLTEMDVRRVESLQASVDELTNRMGMMIELLASQEARMRESESDVKLEEQPPITHMKEVDPTDRDFLLSRKKKFIHENCDRASLVELVDRAWDTALRAVAERKMATTKQGEDVSEDVGDITEAAVHLLTYVMKSMMDMEQEVSDESLSLNGMIDKISSIRKIIYSFVESYSQNENPDPIPKDKSDELTRSVISSLVSSVQVLKVLRVNVPMVYQRDVDLVYENIIKALAFIN